MKTAIFALGLALGANAAPTSTECWFSIHAYGVQGTVSEGDWGMVAQLPDGQLRIGQSNLKSKSKFCLNRSTFGLKDQNGFGCIIAGRERQFQCDHGKAPFTGWNVGCDGIVTFQGSATFWSCATGDHGGYNIYTDQLPGDYCTMVTLIADAQCHASCKTPTVPQLPKTPTVPPMPRFPAVPRLPIPPVTRPSAPTPTCKGSPRCPGGSQCSGSSCSSSSHLIPLKCPGPDCAGHQVDTCKGKPGCYKTWSCPAVLKGSWEFPHLIVPVSRRQPNHAFGTQYFGSVSSYEKTYFNFDIGQHLEGKQCTVNFMFPTKDQLETSDFNLTGSGMVSAGWTKEVSQSVTWNTAPKCPNAKSFKVQPGNSYVLAKGECKPGVMGFMMEGGVDSYLHWFQDFNPCPMGLYITVE